MIALIIGDPSSPAWLKHLTGLLSIALVFYVSFFVRLPRTAGKPRSFAPKFTYPRDTFKGFMQRIGFTLAFGAFVVVVYLGIGRLATLLSPYK